MLPKVAKAQLARKSRSRNQEQVQFLSLNEINVLPIFSIIGSVFFFFLYGVSWKWLENYIATN